MRLDLSERALRIMKSENKRKSVFVPKGLGNDDDEIKQNRVKR